MLKNPSEVTLVPKNVFFPKILNFVQSFVERKVSLADGIYSHFQKTSIINPKKRVVLPEHAFDDTAKPGV